MIFITKQGLTNILWITLHNKQNTQHRALNWVCGTENFIINISCWLIPCFEVVTLTCSWDNAQILGLSRHNLYCDCRFSIVCFASLTANDHGNIITSISSLGLIPVLTWWVCIYEYVYPCTTSYIKSPHSGKFIWIHLLRTMSVSHLGVSTSRIYQSLNTSTVIPDVTALPWQCCLKQKVQQILWVKQTKYSDDIYSDLIGEVWWLASEIVCVKLKHLKQIRNHLLT